MAEAYLELHDLKNRNEAFKDSVNSSLDYLIGKINGLSTAHTGLKISAYNPVVSSTGIQLDNVYGQLTLEELDRTSHIPVDNDNYGNMRALSSVEIETGSTETNFAPNNDIRVVIDEENEIWSTVIEDVNTDSGSIWIKIITPITGQTPNFLSIYPLAGTVIDTIKVKHTSGYTEINPSTEWPIKLHQNFSDYQNEVRIKLNGIRVDTGGYRFSLKKIEIYSVRYASEGTFTYLTEDAFTDISSVTYNSPYFYPVASQNVGMIRIRVLTKDSSTILYDNTRSTAAFVVPAGPEQVIVECTLYRIDGSTPFIKNIS